MCEKVNFNVIEKNKYDNIDDITKFINNIVNKLIVNEFAKSVDWNYSLLYMRLYKMSSLPIGG